MNREYIVLSDNNSIIIDDGGNTSEREYDDNLYDILLAENNIEKVDIEINKLKEELEDDEKFMAIYNKLKSKMPSASLFILSIGLLTGLIDLVAILLVFALVITSGFRMLKHKIKDDITCINHQIDKMNLLRQMYVDRKEKLLKKGEDNDKKEVVVNKIIKIENDPEVDKKIVSELDRAYEEVMSIKGKKRVLTRN